MEKDIKDVEYVIKSLFKEICGDEDLITKIWMKDDSYQVQKREGEEVIIARQWVEDYLASGDRKSKAKIMNSLKILGNI